MAHALRVALIGFSPFERTTLEAFFRLAARRKPSYEHGSSPDQADVVLVDADNPAATAAAQPWATKSVTVGTASLPRALGQIPRPINMMVLLKLLDALLARRPAATRWPDEKGCLPIGAVQTPEPELESSEPPRDSDFQPSCVDSILVVDDSDIALRFMGYSLRRFGFDVQFAKSGEQALQRVAEHHFECVFMDVNMPGIDGYQTCKLIKRRPYPTGRHAPRVVMLTSRSGTLDKARGMLAGCDGYLTKPLEHDALMKTIGNRIVDRPATVDIQLVL